MLSLQAVKPMRSSSPENLLGAHNRINSKIVFNGGILPKMTRPSSFPVDRINGKYSLHGNGVVGELAIGKPATPPDLASRVASCQARTREIPKGDLEMYLEAAAETGFKVKKIANEGEEFPRDVTFGRTNMIINGKRIVRVSKVRAGEVAISIESNGRKDDRDRHAVFERNVTRRMLSRWGRQMIEDAKLRGKKILL